MNSTGVNGAPERQDLKMTEQVAGPSDWLNIACRHIRHHSAIRIMHILLLALVIIRMTVTSIRVRQKFRRPIWQKFHIFGPEGVPNRYERRSLTYCSSSCSCCHQIFETLMLCQYATDRNITLRIDIRDHITHRSCRIRFKS